MVTQCIVCHRIFKAEGLRKNLPHTAKVCGRGCFLALLNKRMPSSYTKVPKFYTDTMLKFKHSELEMRSSYERGVAQWLKDNQIVYFYEPYLFYLSGYRGYVPDFFLPYSNTFIEVKGRWEGNAYSKYKQFKQEFNHNIYLIDKEFMKRIECHVRKKPV